MSVDAVIAANAPYWGAEAEICRTYFRSATRDATSDATWLARQAAKELLDGVVPRLRLLDVSIASGEVGAGALVDVAEELHEEAAHYAAFVDAYERIRPPGAPDLDRDELESAVAWPGNVALRELRACHLARDGRLGAVAGAVTEGGCCALFREGIALAGGTAADDAIADACGAVLTDEVDHMLVRLELAGRSGLGDQEWAMVVEMSLEQSRARLVMREEQFGGAVGPERLAALVAAGTEPLLPERA